MSLDYQIAVVADAPELYLRADELTGTVMGDTSGNARHQAYQNLGAGVALGGPSGIETDADSRSVIGSGARIARVEASSGALNLNDNFAWEFWARPTGGSSVRAAISKGGLVGTWHNSIYLTGSLFWRFHLSLDNGSSLDDYVLTAPVPAVLNSWYHVVGVRNGNTMILYINGPPVTFRTDLSPTDPINESFDYFLGSNGDGTAANAQFFIGNLEEYAIYPSLSAARVLAHYEAAVNTLEMRGVCNIFTTAVLYGGTEPDPAEYPFRHNWSSPVIERFRWKTSRFSPVNGPVELSKQRSGLRRQLEYSHLLYDDLLRRRWEAMAFGGRKTKLQFEPDKVAVGAVLAATTSLSFDATYLDFQAGHFVLFYESDTAYEYKELVTATDGGISWDGNLTRDYSNCWVKPARIAHLPVEQEMELHTDVVGEASTIYDYLVEDEPLNPRRIVPFTLTLTYDGGECWDLRQWQGHDYSEPPVIEYAAEASELDSEVGVVTRKRYRWGAEVVRPYRMILDGRLPIARYLGWLYARAGSYLPFWMPTFRSDLEIVSGVGSTLTVSGHEYTGLYAPADNRADLAFVYFDGTYILRRVTGSTTAGNNDALTLSAAVPTLTNLRWLCFLRKVTLASDDLEIAWETDNKAVVAFAVTDAPQAEFPAASPSMSASVSSSVSLSVSPSASQSPSSSTSISQSPSASVSPSSSMSPSSSASASPSPSSSVSPSASESPSTSPSSSASPSSSESLSVSPSASESPSLSPSASTSPSTSVSPSVSPSSSTSPSAGEDPDFASVVLLVPWNGTNGQTTATDLSNSAHALTFALNAAIDTAQSQFGGSSLHLDGVNDVVTAADHADWHFGTGDFTIEAFIRVDNFTTEAIQTIISQYDNNGNQRSWSFRLTATALELVYSVDGTNAVIVTGSFTFSVDTWYYVAVKRTGTSVTLHAALASDPTTTLVQTHDISTNSLFNSTSLLRVGISVSSGANAWDFNGWMNQTRITKGVARDVSNVPTVAFPTS